MNRFIFSVIFILHLAIHSAGAQPRDDDDYTLYLTQIAAAEALLQLNKISEARAYLDACEERFRDVEWRFLRSNLDQSSLSLMAPSGVTYSDLELNPRGDVLALATSDNIVALYSYPGLVLIRELRGHTGPVTTLAFSHDGKRVASGGRDRKVIVWNAEDGSQISVNDRSFSQGIYQLRFSPHDSLLGVVSWERVADRPPHIFGFFKVLDGTDARELRRMETDNHPASGIEFSPDGKTAVVSTWGEIAYSFDVGTGNENWRYDLSDPKEYNAFHSIDISPDGATIALGCTDHRVHILNSPDGSIRHVIQPWDGHSKIVKSVAFSGDGKLLATAGEDQTILIWNVADYSIHQSLIGHTATVTGLAWAKDGQEIVSSSLDGTSKVWSLARPFETTYEICDFGPWQTPVTSGGTVFAAPCSDKKLRMYEAASGKIVHSVGDQSALCADISKNSRYLVTAGFDGVVHSWDLRQANGTSSYRGHTSRVDGIDYADSAGLILSVGDTTLRVWRMNSERELTIVGFPKKPFRVVLSPDERSAYVGFGDGTIARVDTRSWGVTDTFRSAESIQEMTLSPGGELMAIFSGKSIEVWKTSPIERVSSLRGHEKSGYGIGFSNDGRYLISGSDDQTFKLWNVERGQCAFTYHGMEEVVYSCKFLSSNEILLSSSEGKMRYFKF